MRKGMKFLIVLNLICYINSLILSYQTSIMGMKTINPFWLVSPYLFIFISLFTFSTLYSMIRKYTIIDFAIRYLAILIIYKGSNYELFSSLYIILTLIGISIFIINIFIEINMYNKVKQYCIDHDIKEISLSKIGVLIQDEEIKEKIKESGKRVHRHWYNWWSLIFAIVIFIIGIIFVQSNQLIFIIAAIVIFILQPFLVLKSIKSHLKIFDYIEYDKSYIKKRKIINVSGVFLAYIFVFLISFFGSKDLSYVNGLMIIFLLPLYRTENKSMLKNKVDLDNELEKKLKEIDDK